MVNTILMNRSLYTRFRSAYLVLDGIMCDNVKLGFSQSKKKVCDSVYKLLFNIYIDHHEKLRFYK